MKMKWKSLIVLFALLLATTQMSSASAVSEYDNVFTTTPALVTSYRWNGLTCDKENLSNTFESYITDSSRWPANNYARFEASKISFEKALTSGSWGVSMDYAGDIDDPDNLSHNYSATPVIFWSEDSQMQLEWYSSGVVVNHVNYVQLGCDPQTHKIASGASMAVDKGLYVASSALEKSFIFAGNPNYPSGYAGIPIQTEVPTPPMTTYNGSIDCGNDTLEYLEIRQDGNTYAVPLSYTSIYSANWSYDLTDSPYIVTVGCGNTLATSYKSETPMPPTSNDWMCDTINDPHYCILD